MIVFYAFLFCFGFCYGQNTKYVVNFDSPVYVCPDGNSVSWIDTSKIEVVRVDEATSQLSGVVEFKKGLEDKTMIELRLEKESTPGRYEMVFSHEICDLCGELVKEDGDYKDYLTYFGFPEKCPFEAGSYKINNMIADTSSLPINSNNAGRYLATIFVYENPSKNCKNDKKFLSCTKLDLLIESA